MEELNKCRTLMLLFADSSCKTHTLQQYFILKRVKIKCYQLPTEVSVHPPLHICIEATKSYLTRSCYASIPIYCDRDLSDWEGHCLHYSESKYQISITPLCEWIGFEKVSDRINIKTDIGIMWREIAGTYTTNYNYIKVWCAAIHACLKINCG